MTIKTTKSEAIQSAARVADHSRLPQTVFKDQDGYWHTESMSRTLRARRVFVTMLPACWFDNARGAS